jgi:hypothetical protein
VTQQGSTDTGQMNLKSSWIASAFSTPRESTRPGTVTDSKVLQMRCSIRPKGPARRKSLKKEVNYIYGGPELYESRRK